MYVVIWIICGFSSQKTLCHAELHWEWDRVAHSHVVSVHFTVVADSNFSVMQVGGKFYMTLNPWPLPTHCVCVNAHSIYCFVYATAKHIAIVIWQHEFRYKFMAYGIQLIMLNYSWSNKGNDWSVWNERENWFLCVLESKFVIVPMTVCHSALLNAAMILYNVYSRSIARSFVHVSTHMRFQKQQKLLISKWEATFANVIVSSLITVAMQNISQHRHHHHSQRQL